MATLTPHGTSKLTPDSQLELAFDASLIPEDVRDALPDDIHIRPLASTDYHRSHLSVLSILSPSPDTGYAPYLAQFNAIVKTPGTYYPIVLISKSTDQVVGTGCIFIERKFLRNLGLVGHIEDIAVDKSQQGKKLGLRVIQALVGISERLGCYKTILNCSDANIPFYEKCGFIKKENEMAKYAGEIRPVTPMMGGGRSILNGDDDDGIDDIGQIDQIIDSFEEQLHRLRVQRSKIPKSSITDSTLDDDSGVDELDEILRMDEEINFQEDRLRRLRTRRNSKIPISRLPIELMTHIFTYCVPRHHFAALASRKWYSFTHVCHSWRSIALNHAPLWTLVNDLSSIKLARTMFERSKTAILDIMLRSAYRPEWEELSRAIQEELPRIAHIEAHIDDRYHGHIKGLVYDLIQPAPSLRSIKLVNNDDTRMKLPDQFLDGQAPLLTQIYLHSIEIPWNSPLLQTLTSLELSRGDYIKIPTGKQMFDALRSMPRLEVLDLTGIFPRDITETDLIPLPKLRQLSLDAPSEDLDACTGFIKHLSFPRTTTLHIEYFAGENVDAFKPILSHLSKIFSESRNEPSVVESPRTIRSLSLGLDDVAVWDYSVITLKAWNIGSVPSYTTGPSLPGSPPILHLRFQRDQLEPRSQCHILDDLKTILGSFQMNTIETFHIYGGGNIWKEDYDHYDNHITSTNHLSECLRPVLWSASLKTLRAYGSYYSDQLPTLLGARYGSDSRSSAESPTPAFPALLEAYIDFYPRTRHLLCQLESLVGALKSCMKNGDRLGKLTIKNFYLTEEQVASLKEVVEELDWDVEE
uniref:glucosamine-phosphate N-acetyltransferase n=1 Tax=Moniliophthora roreri TaxID=221103 RepID=A0A0W0FTK6_MONRR